ncbi:MAG: sugar ABC transporter permease [Clostridia bacterium]|nr:sugar ABC transporter permease [Clostridia bacterium]
MVDSKHQWKAWIYLLPAIILLIIFTLWPIINTVTTAFIYNVEYKPVIIQVEAVENADEEYLFTYVDSVEGDKCYMSAVVEEDGSVDLEYVSTPDGTNGNFKYDNDIMAWTVTVGEKQYFIGATDDSDASLFEVTEDNVSKLGSSIYPASLFTESANKHATSELDPKAGYNFGIFKGVSEAVRYVLASSEEGYLNTTDYLNESAMLWPEKCKVGEKNGFKFYYEDEDYNYLYLNTVVNEEGEASIEYTLDQGVGFYYNSTHKAWVCLINDTEYYLGLDGINRIGVYSLADVGAENAPTPAVMYMHRGEASAAVEMTNLSEDDAYRIGAHRAADGTQTYITTGAAVGGGLMLTEDFVNGEVFSKFGMNNFTYVLTSRGSDFIVCLKNTLILTVITVPISTILALLIAVGLNSIKPLQKLLQTIFFLPYVTNSIAIGMVFAAMFNIVGINSTQESVGIINNILGLFGVERINWINYGAETWASFTALIVYIIWNALPFKILILLGGLQSINKQYYDAAKIDSTPKWRVLTRITVPLLSPMLTYTVITSFIGGFKEYSSVVGIFGEDKAVAGGANMNTIVGHIQNHLTITRDYGLAGAAALMLFVIIFIVTMINLRISKKSTHY